MSECAFDHPERMCGRLLNFNTHVFSVLSSPRLVPGHSLVIPRRHIIPGTDRLMPSEAIGMEEEVERLRGAMLKMGYKGVDVFQKTRPEVAEGHNRTKMHHLHAHVVPSNPGDEIYERGLVWGSSNSFSVPSSEELAGMRAELKAEQWQ